jgi:hypothetical protein
MGRSKSSLVPETYGPPCRPYAEWSIDLQVAERDFAGDEATFSRQVNVQDRQRNWAGCLFVCFALDN